MARPSTPHAPRRAGSMSRPVASRRRTLVAAGISVLLLVSLYVLLPRLAGLRATWSLLGDARPGWLAVALGAEIASYAGYVLLARVALAAPGGRLGWRLAYDLTMAGVAATRLLATAGAGGIALTVWALRRLGVDAPAAARRTSLLLVALYAPFLAGIALTGVALREGLLPGDAPVALTLVPAACAAVAMSIVLVAALAGGAGSGDGTPAWARWAGAPLRLLGRGVRDLASALRRRERWPAGAVLWWGADMTALWASLHAFGVPPPLGALVMAYLVGQLGNLLPLPGGVGGVDGGLIGSLIAFGTAGATAVAAVLTYRAFSFWLPTLPGFLAFVRLRRRLGGDGD